MSPNDRPHVYVTFNPEAGTRTPAWILHPKPPMPEPIHIGVLGGTDTWMA